MNNIDMSYIKVIESSDKGNVLLSNGEDTIDVPIVGGAVVTKLNGQRSIEQVRKEIYDEYKVDVNIEDFIYQLNEINFLVNNRKKVKENIKILGVMYRKIFLNIPFFMLVVGMLPIVINLLLKNFGNFINYNYIFVSKNISLSVLVYFFLSWFLVIEHELCHYLASVSYDMPAKFSLGTRLQFLVAQTTILSPYELNKKERLKVYLTGIITDFFICEVNIILININFNNTVSNLLRCILYLKISAIIWQFLFYMKTDIYYCFVTLFDEKNLMKDAELFLKTRSSKNKLVKIYSFFLLGGRFISFVYFLIFQLPLIAVTFSKIYSRGFDFDSIFSSLLLLFGWIIFLIVFIRNKFIKKIN